MVKNIQKIQQHPVHPHIRGDNCSVNVSATVTTGSPPHTWGQYPENVLAIALVRFTPTYVGTIISRRRPRRAASVHPHIRGDNLFLLGLLDLDRGSPPHTWGQYPQSCFPPYF